MIQAGKGGRPQYSWRPRRERAYCALAKRRAAVAEAPDTARPARLSGQENERTPLLPNACPNLLGTQGDRRLCALRSPQDHIVGEFPALCTPFSPLEDRLGSTRSVQKARAYLLRKSADSKTTAHTDFRLTLRNRCLRRAKLVACSRNLL